MLNGITIDGKGSRDLDDAVWVKPTEKDGYVASIIISNVAANVKKGSIADQQVMRNKASVYCGSKGCIKPMLPAKLSEDKLSLLYHRTRKVMVFNISLDSRLDATSISLNETEFVNHFQLTHTQITDILQDSEHVLHEQVQWLSLLSDRLLRKRRQSGSTLIYDLEAGWEITEEGLLRELPVENRNIGYLIVQELMILANTTLAEFMVRHNIPCLFRNHKAKKAAPLAGQISKDLQDAIELNNEDLIQQTANRAALIMEKATIDSYVQGHYGLAAPAYGWFTSPVRRLPDLINQRMLLAHLNQTVFPYSDDELASIAGDFNDHTQAEAEKKSEYLRQKAWREGVLHLKQQNFSSLDDNEFHRVVCVSNQSKQPVAESLQSELCHRLERDSLPEKTLAQILLDGANGFSVCMRQRIIIALKQRPFIAPVVLHILGQQQSTSSFESDVKSTGQKHQLYFTASAQAIISGVHYQSRDITSSKKKEAEQLAMLDIIQQLLGVKIDLGEPLPTEEALLPEPEAPSISLQSKNYKGVLQEWCQKHQYPMPKYTTTKTGCPHEPDFGTEVLVTVGDQEQMVSVSGASSKKESERQAAEAYCERYGLIN